MHRTRPGKRLHFLLTLLVTCVLIPSAIAGQENATELDIDFEFQEALLAKRT